MSTCEKCKASHDGSYGSGRFCSKECARSFSTQSKRTEINCKVSSKLKGDSSYAWNKGKRTALYVTVTCPCGISREIRSCEKNPYVNYCNDECQAKFRPRLMSDVNKRSHAAGHRVHVHVGRTKWYQYNGIHVQGTYELRACRILDEWKRLGKITEWEYTNDRVPYTWEDGTEHTYLLDFKVQYPSGEMAYIETKGYTREHDERKWEAVRELGFTLHVWFHEDLLREETELAPSSNGRM